MYNRALDAFLAVADCGSFTKASEQLFISHTAVIKQVNGLEAHLGVRLFRRTPRGAFLTASGQCLYEKAREIIQFSDAAIRAVQAAHFAAPKTLRIGTSLFYPCHIFMDLWDKICDNFPGYQLKIVQIEDDAQRFQGLDSAYDFLIGAYNSEIGNRSEYPFIPIGRYRFHIALPRRHPLARRRALGLSDLSGETLMMMKAGHSEINDRIRQEIVTDYPDINLTDISPHYSLRTFNECSERGALLLSLECWKEVHPGLVSVPLDVDESLPFGILTAQHPSEDVSRFTAAIQMWLREHGGAESQVISER